MGSPTILEFIDRFRLEMSHGVLAPFRDPENQKKLMQRIFLLSKMACCSYELVQLPPSLLAASILSLAVKMTVKAVPSIHFNSLDLKCLIKTSAKLAQDFRASKILDQTKALLRFVSTFETDFPNLKNIKATYPEEFPELQALNSHHYESQTNLVGSSLKVGIDDDNPEDELEAAAVVSLKGLKVTAS